MTNERAAEHPSRNDLALKRPAMLPIFVEIIEDGSGVILPDKKKPLFLKEERLVVTRLPEFSRCRKSLCRR